MIRIRRSTGAFSPFARQECLIVHPKLFSIIRHDPSGTARIVCCFNVSGSTVELELAALGVTPADKVRFLLPTDEEITTIVSMQPYSFFWLEVDTVTEKDD